MKAVGGTYRIADTATEVARPPSDERLDIKPRGRPISAQITSEMSTRPALGTMCSKSALDPTSETNALAIPGKSGQ
jgi:hypothetical protein